MTVSYQGASYPICCTGCRDEFNENPEKYLKKAKLMAISAPSKPAGGGAMDGTAAGSATVEASTAGKTKEKAESPTGGSGQSATRAATLLLMGQKLEKAGNSAGALRYYRQITKDFGSTPAAKTAAGRIKALEAK
jgi:hypothetical protein